jgi:hypothetical protein
MVLFSFQPSTGFESFIVLYVYIWHRYAMIVYSEVIEM